MLIIFALFAFLALTLFSIVSATGFRPATLAALRAAPAQLRGLVNRSVRRNQLLAHATLNVAEERLGPLPLAALADDSGFVVLGGLPPEVVEEAAGEALSRLRAGERQLTVYPRSVTAILAAQLLLAGLVVVALALLHLLSGLPLLVGLVAAAFAGPRLSPALQRLYAGRAHPGDLALEGVTRQPPAGRLGLLSLMVLGPVAVRTGNGIGVWDDPGRGRATLITGDRADVTVGNYRVGPPR